MTGCARSRARSGLTLIEVLASSVVLSVLALAIGSATQALQQGVAATSLSVDVQSDARRVLAEIRHELRQSGWEGSTNQVSSPVQGGVASAALTFRKRTALADGGWSSEITYRVVADGTFSGVPGTPARFRLQRVQDGHAIGLARNVAAFQLTRQAGSDTIQVTVTLMRRGASSSAAPVRFTLVDQVQVLNPSS